MTVLIFGFVVIYQSKRKIGGKSRRFSDSCPSGFKATDFGFQVEIRYHEVSSG